MQEKKYYNKKLPLSDTNKEYYQIGNSIISREWYEDKVSRTFSLPSNIDFYITEEAKATNVSKSDLVTLILYEYIMNEVEEDRDESGIR